MDNLSISKESSSAVKGILIFLIVLGHNAVFTRSVSNAFDYLYTFHVQSFFILPFLYESKKIIIFKDGIVKNFIRLYYPFLLFFILLSLLNYIVANIIGNGLDLNKTLNINIETPILSYLWTLFTGNYYLIDYFSGFQYLWFMPVMFSMMVVKTYWNVMGKYVQKFLLALGFICYVMFFVFMYRKPYDTVVNYYIMNVSPFAILQGIGAFFLGFSFIYLLTSKYLRKIMTLCPFLFILLSLLFFYNEKTDVYYVARFLMPYIFMGTLWYFRKKIAKLDFLKKFGDLSFQIYIIHPILCHIFFYLCNRYLGINLINACVVQLIVFMLSYYLAYIINNMTYIRKKIFPRSLNELME